MIEETQALTGMEIERAYVDKGKPWHNAPKPRRVFRSGQECRVFGTIRRKQRRRAAIGVEVGHMKTDGHPGRNLLKGRAGDHADVALTAAGCDVGLVRKWLRAIWAEILIAIFAALRPKSDLNPAC